MANNSSNGANFGFEQKLWQAAEENYYFFKLFNQTEGSIMSNFQEKETFIWDLADLLRGTYKRNS